LALTPGSRLGAYEVTTPIGEGGMGQVYRATDTTLGRQVAIKVLPDAFAADPERMARFEREAKTLASLNHPNIAAIYGFEKSGGTYALVMELVEGDDLSQRIEKGAIPLDEALPIARQIAEALEAAHEAGIMHRDLKPANIKVREDGTVKVLDFGLAKAMEPAAGASSSMSMSPTITTPAMTQAGMILGTAAYMAPEQARGRVVDKRSDIWAFGCVLYEMLTGKRAFDGETITDVLSRVLERSPDFEILPAKTPVAIRRLLRRSLQKDRRARLRDAGDAIGELDEAGSEPSGVLLTAPARRRRFALVAGVVAILLVVVAALGWLISRGSRAPAERSLRFGIPLPPGAEISTPGSRPLVFSPDGLTLVLRLSVGESPAQLYARSLGEFDWTPIPGTERAGVASFSRDGQWLYFDAENKLWKVPARGGTRVLIADRALGGAITGPDDTIIYTPSYSQGLWHVGANGGKPAKLTEPVAAAGELGHFWPQMLPDGETVLFTAYAVPLERSRISLYSLRTREQKVLIEGGVSATYVNTGHVLYVRADALMALPFDAARLEPRGQSISVLDDVGLEPGLGSAYFATSDIGDLAYVRASDFRHNRVIAVDPTGVIRPVAPAGRNYEAARVSPDARRLAMTIRDSTSRDVWTYDLERGVFTKVTLGLSDEFGAIWTPDGKRLIFSVEEPVYHTYWKTVDTVDQAELLLDGPYDSIPQSVSPDGRFLVFQQGHPETGSDLWLLPLQGKREPSVLVRSPFQETNGAVSPDGRWLAYQSDESGRPEVYVQGFPEPGERSAVSTQGGTDPVWSRDGRELFYRDQNSLMAVAVRTTTRFSADRPVVVFERPGRTWSFNVSGNGRNFVVVERDPAMPPASVNVILNWNEELKRLLPVD
jgi:dipeptidyl aminopeptidase/acylaminoacyl peptidase